MRDCKCGDDTEDLEESLAESRHRLPAAAAVLEHGRQQEGAQKQYVIEPGPDMPDPGLEEFEKLLHQRRRSAFELPGVVVGAQYGRVCSPLLLQAKQTAVVRIEIEEKGVADRQEPGRGCTLAGEPQDRVGAVAVVVDQLLGDSERTTNAVRGDRQPGQCIRGDLGVFGLDFSPGDLAVAVGIEPDRIVEIAQRNVPLAAEAVAREQQREIAVARLVRLCRRNPQEQ